MSSDVHQDSGGNRGGGSHVGAGVALSDLECPICVETIKDPFVTTCGHTFCFTCINTHLKNKSSCPSCSMYLTQDSIHPNFLLNKISHKASGIKPRQPSSLVDHISHVLATSSSTVRVQEIQQVIELLEVQKAQLRQQETTNNMELLLLFLQHAKSKKLAQLTELQAQVSTLDRDLITAKQRCHPVNMGPPSQPLPDAFLSNHTTGPSTGPSTGLSMGGAALSQALNSSHLSETNPAGLPMALPMLRAPPITQFPAGSVHEASNLGAAAAAAPGHPLASTSLHSNSGLHSSARLSARNTSHSSGSQVDAAAAGASGSGSKPIGFRPYGSGGSGSSIPQQPALKVHPPPPLPSSALARPPSKPRPPTEATSSTTSSDRLPPAAMVASSQPRTQATAIDPFAARPSASSPPSAPPNPALALPSAQPTTSIAVTSSNRNQPPIKGEPGVPLPAAPAAAAAVDPVRVAKRRRIMMQFEELQQCYLRLRSSQINREGVAGVDLDDTALDVFTQMLSAATHFAKLAVVAELPRATGRHTILSSIEFDMNEQVFATAGVTQRISFYDFESIMASPRDTHQPLMEIPARSKLSCISWSPATRHHLISSDYEGIIQLWDVSSSRSIQEYEAHERRIWSVNFNPSDPQYFASGSDDGKVKLWSANDSTTAAINIDVKANVCSVHFNPTQSHSLAVASANHMVHLYDLRRARDPVTTFTGHRKAVSYVRWASSHEIVSASTDSTLRLWDTNTGTCARTFSGHGNEKNFVGLSVDGEFIACGSELNRLYVYYKAIPKPTMFHSFSPKGEVENTGHFVTAVCWKKGMNHLIAANSSGTLWVLSLVD